MRNIKLSLIAILPYLFFNTSIVEARSGCCSHHGGVCGCGCCDGTSLSAKCAPYYPNCGSAYTVITTPPPTKKPTQKPTFKPAPSLTPTSMLNDNSIINQDAATQVLADSVIKSETKSTNDELLPLLTMGGFIYWIYSYLKKRFKDEKTQEN